MRLVRMVQKVLSTTPACHLSGELAAPAPFKTARAAAMNAAASRSTRRRRIRLWAQLRPWHRGGPSATSAPSLNRHIASFGSPQKDYHQIGTMHKHIWVRTLPPQIRSSRGDTRAVLYLQQRPPARTRRVPVSLDSSPWRRKYAMAVWTDPASRANLVNRGGLFK